MQLLHDELRGKASFTTVARKCDNLRKKSGRVPVAVETNGSRTQTREVGVLSMFDLGVPDAMARQTREAEAALWPE